MSDLNEAAKSVKNFAKQFRDIVIVGEALEKIDNLEKVVQSSEKRATAFDKEAVVAAGVLADFESKLAETTKELETAEAGIDSATKKAVKDAQDWLQAAREEADKAWAEADAKIQMGQEAAMEEDILHREKMKEAKAELDLIHGRIADAKADLADIKARLG